MFSGAFFSWAHPYYVSICLIEHNKQNQSLEISVKIFTDDLLIALSEQGHDRLYLGEEREDTLANKYINNYIGDRMRFIINRKEANLHFVGKETENDLIWIYLEIKNIAALNEFEIDCSLLIDVIEEQTNIIQVYNSSKSKSLLLNAERTKGYLLF